MPEETQEEYLLQFFTYKHLPAETQEEYLLQFFTYKHLPAELRGVSRAFCELAQDICRTLPRNPERTVALRKLLEAKDCAVRARIFE